MRVFLIGLLICFFVVVGFAQGSATVTGTVKQGDQPESGAIVGIRLKSDPKKEFVTTADKNGNFKFENLPAGNYTISSGGKASSGRQVDVIAKDEIELSVGETRNVDLHLDRYPIQETVTVSTAEPQPESAVSKTVDIIDGQEMRDRADFTLVDTLRSIPGIRVQQLGGFGKTANIKTRGLRNQDTAVLIDGIRFRDAASITGDATPFLSDFTLTSVSRVEVLRGSGSSLYGTNAIGGVIDFLTPRAPCNTHGQVSGALGGLGLERVRGTLTHATCDGKFGFTTGASRTVYTKGVDGQDDANNTNLQGRVDLSPNLADDISARFFFSDSFVRLNSNPDTLGSLSSSNNTIFDARPNVNFVPDPNDPDDTQRSRFFSGQIVASHRIGNAVELSGYYQGLTTRRKNITGPLGVGFQSNSTNIFEGTIHTANAHLLWTPVEGNSFTAGYEFERESFSNDSSSDFSPQLVTKAAQSSDTFYIQELTGFYHGRLQISGGFRAQLFDLSHPNFNFASPLQNLSLDRPPTAYTFDGSAAYYFRTAKTKIRAHVGNGYRAPSLFERFASFFGFIHPDELFLAGGPDLKPEHSIAVDAGIERTFMTDRIKLSATFFYTSIDRAINYGFFPEPDPFGRVNSETFGGYQNTKGFISRGAEFSSELHPTRLTDIFASYTFTNSDQREPQVSGSGVIESVGIPKHQFTLVATQRIKKFWISFDFLAASDYFAPIFSSSTFNAYVYRFQGNRRGDLTAGYNFDLKKDRINLRLFGTIENIFDDKYFENGFRTPARNGRVGISLGF